MNGLKTAINPWCIIIATFAACTLSFLVNGIFFASLGNTIWCKSLLVASSAIFETVKIIGLSIAVWCYFAKHPKFCIASSSIYLVLFVVSVLASISVINLNIQKNNVQTLTATQQYQDIDAQLKIKQQAIAILQKNAAIDSEKGYRERSNATITKAQQIEQELINLHNQKNNLTNSDPNIPVLNYLPKKLLMLIIIFLGGLLEFVTGYLLAIKQWQKLDTSIATIDSSIATIDSSIATIDSSIATATSSDPIVLPVFKQTFKDKKVVCLDKMAVNDVGHISPEPLLDKGLQSPESIIATIATTDSSIATIDSSIATIDSIATTDFSIDTVALLLKQKKLLPNSRELRKYLKISNKKACQFLKNLSQLGVVHKASKGYMLSEA